MTVVGRVEALDGHHTYVHPVTGEIFPAVSSIIAATTSKPWLAQWAAKLSAEWVADHLQLVNLTHADAGRGAVVDLVKGRAKEAREFKADVGSYVHTVLETLILGGGAIPPIPDHLVGKDYDGEPLTPELVDAITDGFLAFVSDFDVAFEFAEVTVANRAEHYAGTLDMGALLDLGSLGVLRLVIDAKTGKHLNWTMRVQQAAYSDPRNEVWLPNGQVMPLPEYQGAAVLHLRREYESGYKLLYVTDEELQTARAHFRLMRDLYEIGRAESVRPGRVIYPPREDGTQPPPLIEDLDGVPGVGRCRGKLLAAGFRTLDDLARLTVVQLRQVDGIGPKAAKAVQDALAAHGMALATERERTA